MALSAEIQHGVARIYGQPPINSAADEMSYTIAGVIITSGSGFNPSGISWTDGAKVDEIASSDGSVIESMIFSQRRRELSIEMIPSSTSATPTRAEALAAVTHFLTNCLPGSVWVLSGFNAALTWVNGTSATDGSFNYMPSGEIVMRRDAPVIMNIRLVQFLTRADGAKFAALPLAS